MRDKTARSDKKNKKRTDDFEDTLRRTMCIFICFEAVGFSYIMALSGDHTYLGYFFHEKSYIRMFLQSCSGIALPMLLAVLPLLLKPMYYLTEILHVILGIIVFLFVAADMNILLALPAFLIFSGRFLLYLFIMKKHNKYINNSIINDVRANINREKDDRLR